MQSQRLTSRRPAVIVAALLSAAAGTAHAQLYTSEPEVAIPEVPTLTNTITVTGGPETITDVNVVLSIEHEDLSQLDIVLIPPGGTHYLTLSADTVGLNGGFVRTRFDDEACWPIYYGSGTFSATYKPEGGLVIPWLGTPNLLPPWWRNNLTELNGVSANGAWTLVVDDDTDGTTGILHRWSLEFNHAIDPGGPPDLLQICATGTTSPLVSREGELVTVRVTVQPRTNPPSTGVTAFAFLDSLNLPVLPLYDDGLHNDGTAGDNVYGGSFGVPPGAGVGKHDVNFLVQDEQSRFGAGATTLDIAPMTAWMEMVDGGGDARGMPASCQPLTAWGRDEIRGYLGSPDDVVDTFAISICTPTVFRASTVGATTWDTQLFLFDSEGRGVVMNDDAFASYQSTITSLYVTQPGDYYLSISRYDRDPVDEGISEIWDDANYIFEQQPDGPGAANPVDGWNGITFNPTGPYTILIEGVGPAGACPADACDTIDFNNDTLFPDTLDIDDMLNVFSGGACSNDPNCSDIDFNNDDLFPDVTDIEAFLRVFAGGPCQE